MIYHLCIGRIILDGLLFGSYITPLPTEQRCN